MADGNQTQTNATFGFLVSDVSRMLRENFRTTTPELGLTLAQARVLVHLSRNEGISQVALSAMLEIQPITLLRQIDRLEKAGLIERRAHPSDRRAQQLYLTPRSQPLLKKIFDKGAERQDQVMAGLNEAERQQLMSSLLRIKANLSQMAAATRPGRCAARALQIPPHKVVRDVRNSKDRRRRPGCTGHGISVSKRSAPPLSAAPLPPPVAKKTRGRFTRPLLLFGVPLLVVLFSCYAYLHAGRYVDTNNAYVKADKAIIAAEVTGKIVEVAVKENDHVERGQLLFRLDDTPYKFALDRAEAALTQTAQDIAAMKLQYRQALAEIELAQNNVAYARVTYDRQVGLVERKIGSIADLDDAKHELDTALKQQELASQRAAKILVDLNGNADIAVEAHPRYQTGEVGSRSGGARPRTHERCRAVLPALRARSPKSARTSNAATPVMSLVSDGDMWIEANFKETDLTYLRPNQSVECASIPIPGFDWQGTVQSVSEATGSEFALLPAQNATGNWVKVVQRVAVRITMRARR